MNALSHVGALLLLAVMAGSVSAQVPATARRAYPEGFISGRVTNGTAPEAGVWVIAETKETNTPFIKIVVTDDQGRFTLPQLPDCHLQRVGARLWPAGLRQGQRAGPATPISNSRSKSRRPARRRQGLSRRLLAVAAGGAGSRQLPRHRRQGYRWQWLPARHPEPGRLDASLQEGLQLLPPAGQPDHPHPHAHEFRAAGFQVARGCLAVSHHARRARHQHAGRLRAVRLGGHGKDDGRLDARGGSRRSAADAAAAAGHRAQRRGDAVGHRWSAGFHARRNRHRQEQAHA